MNQPSRATSTTIPPGFEAEMQELRRSVEQESDLEAGRRRLASIEGMLQRLGPDQYPAFRAALQVELGNNYHQLPVGDRADNLRRAMACYEAALTVFSPETAPREYATTQMNLGLASAELPTGDRSDDLRRAIACYEAALTVFSLEAAPREYATTQMDLGIIYATLPTGDRAGNLRQAIACFKKALTVYTPEAAPSDYVGAQMRLGKVHVMLCEGDRADNLRQAIACYEAALTVLTPEATPIEYGVAQVELGHAYRHMREVGMGRSADNVLRAIACYEKALTVLSPEAAPSDHEYINLMIGEAYDELCIMGDNRAADLRRAIACFKKALTVYTPEAAPSDYVGAQMRLGNAYLMLREGDRADNLRQAIACYEAALTVLTPEAAPTDYGMAHKDLGDPYLYKSPMDRRGGFYRTAIDVVMFRGDREGNLPRAIARFDTVEDRVAELRRNIACYEGTLDFQTLEAAPFVYAIIQLKLGLTYAELPIGDRADNQRRAMACYEAALTVLTPESDPDLCRMTADNLGSLYFDECQWDQARAFYTTAIAATEALYQVAPTDYDRRAELAEARAPFSNLAYSLARLGKLNEAIERLEVGKARGLAKALARDRAALDCMEAKDRAAFDFRAIAATAMAECPLVYLITTSQGSLALIVSPSTKTLDTNRVVWLNEFRSDNLNGIFVQRDDAGEAIGGYLLGQMMGEYQQLRAGLDLALPILRDRLMGPLAARLMELGFRWASLVLAGQLSQLPLHAAGFDAVTFTYTPSARALRAARDAARERAERTPVFLGVGNPLPNPQPLSFARTEVEEIASQFEPEAQHLLFEREATRAAIKEALSSVTHLHLACHGTFDVEELLNSVLYLSGDDELTLHDLLDGGLDLSAVRLAVLSACQAGIAEFHKVPDEAIGFPAGLIQAGVPGVVSTLWPVNDISTAILMGRFYLEHLGNGLDPASALHRAQDWLRTATARDMSLAKRYERRYQEGDPDAYQPMRYFQANPEAKPFAHPYFWAAFTFTGAA